MINLAGFINDSIVDGPNIRSVVFVQGCSNHCPHCHNPETWSFEKKNLVNWEDIYAKIKSEPIIKDVTFSGGEPFENYNDLLPLAKQLKKDGYNLCSFSGFTYEELLKKSIEDNNLREFISLLDILIDGKFIYEKRDLTLKYRGSSNQRIIDVQKSLNQNTVITIQDDDI